MLLVRHFLRPVHGGYEMPLLLCPVCGETVELPVREEGDPWCPTSCPICGVEFSSEDDLGMQTTLISNDPERREP